MSVNLWVELDAEGNVLRASDGVRKELIPLFGADLGFPALVRSRADLRAALGRRAGKVRVALGHGATLSQYDVKIGSGGLGARCVLQEGSELDMADAPRRWTTRSQDGVVLTDADGHILMTNASFCRLVGYSADEVTGRYLSVFRSSRTPERLLVAMDRALVGKGSWTGNLVFRRYDGTEFPAWASYTGLVDEEGTTTHYLVVLSDRTEHEEMERLESLDASATLIGRLARGFAHDINNLAGELVALVEAAGDNGSLNAESLARLEKIGGAFGNVGRQLLTLATHSAEPPPADMNRVARDLGWLLTRAAARTREVEVAVDSTPLWVDVQADSLLRGLLQPALRAATEAPADVAILVTTSAHDGEGVITLQYEAGSTERERLRALFPEGGVTSRASNTLQTRALAAGVSLSLELGAGGQVALSASVPLAGAVDEPVAQAEAEPPPRTGRALVVEDNEALQELVVAALKRDFPLTVSARDGVDGLEVLERVGGRVDIVIVDLMMPRMQGLEFLRVARGRYPGLRVIVVSGAASADQIREAAALGAIATLSKPFRVRDLRQVVARALE